jgi:membrane-bound metal-dependent hydrolase YbcI (DUF457 family)
MPDLLAHAFIAYSLCRVLSWRQAWLTTPYVTLGMIGALIPDLVKINLVVPSETVQRMVGVPFEWGSLATWGGTFLSVCVGIVLLSSLERRRGAMLGIGAGSHLLADSLLLTPTGHSVQLFWPLSQYKLPSPGLYLSTQPEPMFVTGGIALLVWATHRFRASDTELNGGG